MQRRRAATQAACIQERTYWGKDLFVDMHKRMVTRIGKVQVERNIENEDVIALGTHAKVPLWPVPLMIPGARC